MSRAIAKTGPVTALGAMSGTSLDGVDVAVVNTDGHNILGFGETGYRSYSESERAVLRAGLGKWSGPEVEAAARVTEAAHIEALQGIEADLIGFHGQTLAHAPRLQGTLQVGDGQVLAEALTRPVVWDFRSDDVTMGGEGAPLGAVLSLCLRQIHWRGPAGRVPKPRRGGEPDLCGSAV